MRILRVGLTAAVGIALMGAAVPMGEMPPNTVMLSEMMRELSARPGFTEAFLAEVEGGAKKAGAARLTPDLVHELRKVILGKDWEKLDHFPGWTMGEINPTVRVVGHVAGRDGKVDEMATAGGAPSGVPGASNGPTSQRALEEYVDLGDYKLSRRGEVSLDEPATGPGFIESEYVKAVGEGVTRGDGANPELAPLHAESTRLAEVLNRLSLNEVGSAAPFQAVVGGRDVQTPDEVVAALLASGHTVEVSDSRFFANFGHLHWKGEDVMMPFWLNTLTVVPHPEGTPGRPLLVPVSHAEYEWQVRGPKVNAAVSFYFGIDGKAEFRTMDQLDQRWVMNRHAREYRGADAVEVTRLAGKIVQAYAHLHEAHPKIAFGGYYGFGVCQDVVAAIEMKMTGKTTLFPNTADERFFTDPRDAEVNALIRSLPKDRGGKAPGLERVFGSLPVGSSDQELATVTVPGLGADLIAVHDAWTAGDVEHVGERRRMRNLLYWLGAALMVGVVWTVKWKRQRREA